MAECGSQHCVGQPIEGCPRYLFQLTPQELQLLKFIGLPWPWNRDGGPLPQADGKQRTRVGFFRHKRIAFDPQPGPLPQYFLGFAAALVEGQGSKLQLMMAPGKTSN